MPASGGEEAAASLVSGGIVPAKYSSKMLAASA